MQVSSTTSSLLRALESFSGQKLTRAQDLGILIELAALHSREDALRALSFQAKFASRAHRIMERIGSRGEGYDTLAQEFALSLETATSEIRILLADAPGDVRTAFEAEYLSMNSGSMEHLLSLLYDLSWYKNWLIDHPAEPR
jgi:hypothetical protein